MNTLAGLGRWAIGSWLGCGRAFILLLDILRHGSSLWRRFDQIVRQLYALGVMSLPIIAVSGLFVGMVLSFQGYTTLAQFGAESALGTMVSLSLLRELGPVVTALLFAGRAGSSMTSEMGLMKATEQIASMQMMAVNPVDYVVFPRFVAGVLALPILAVIFSSVAIVGGYIIGVVQLGVDAAMYWNGMRASVDIWQDIIQGVLIKSLCFGLVASLVSVYQGMNCHPTSEGIGRATTRTVVVTSLWVLAVDFLLTALFFGIN
ncbi:MAG: ABC transporter permease [Gammaproteobacteria bacterium]|nr:MAG: ABC transporter permease [Gammaproteobacteria bacterium]